jgi:hypothetical protein
MLLRCLHVKLKTTYEQDEGRKLRKVFENSIPQAREFVLREK